MAFESTGEVHHNVELAVLDSGGGGDEPDDRGDGLLDVHAGCGDVRDGDEFARSD